MFAETLPIRRRLPGLTLLCALLALAACGAAPQDDPLLAPRDPVSRHMVAGPAPIDPVRNAAHAGYFERPIERLVHQVWFGDPGRMDGAKPALWRAYAQQFGYGYRLWTEADAPELEALLPARSYALWQRFVAEGEYPAASDLARLAVLAAHGGTYSDIDTAPPRVDGALVDLAALVPMRNIVLITEHDGRNIGHDSAIFAGNGFIMAAAGHPLLQHAVATVAANVDALAEAGPEGARAGPAHRTGPFFVNRSLAGCVTLLPITYAEALQMVD